MALITSITKRSRGAIAALGGWTVAAIELPVAGAPLHYPDLQG